jgi:transposase
MKHLFWLNDRQWKKLEPLLPFDARRRRVDDRRIVSGIIYVIKTVCSGRMRPHHMGHTRRCTIASCAEAEKACSIISSPNSPQ